MTEDEPEISEAELDAQIARLGLQLSPGERKDVLATALYLQRAAALVRTYNPAAGESED
jgi:hypothetical protein